MPPVGFYIGPLYIRFYGIVIMLGALAATYLAAYLARKKGEDPERAWDMLIWVLIGGIVGARIWHILTPSASDIAAGLTTGYYLLHPLDAINTTKGGLGIPGAVIGGGLALLWYSRRHHLSFAVWADLIAPGLALAQGIGRWGNFINQELYGAPTNLPWKLYIEPQYRLPGYQNVAYYHPLFLYEFIWNVLNAGFLIWIGRKWSKWLRPGDVFLIYLITYPVFRFFMEFIRLDTSPVAGLDINQVIMAVVAITSSVLLYMRHRKGQPEGRVVEPAEREENQEPGAQESDQNTQPG